MVIQEIAANIYRIEIPLPIPVVGSMNSYIITDPDRNLIVDPGMSRPLCYEAMRAALNELGIDLRRTDFFMTHHHPDHFGLASELMTDGSVIYINRLEADLIERIASKEVLVDMAYFMRIIGFPEKDPLKIASELAGDEYRAVASWSFRYVTGDDLIEKGGHSFRCIVTPGHSIANTCLYEPDLKILLAGDAISPVLQFLSGHGNPLGDHLTSLNWLYQMDIDLVLPGHHSIFRDCRKRIEQLKAHHDERLEAVSHALADGCKSSYQVAASIWRGTADGESWDTLTILQRFFFTRDCFAHFRYLETEGRTSSMQ